MAGIFVDFLAKTERFYWNIPMYTSILSYCSCWGETMYSFCFVPLRCALENYCGESSIFIKVTGCDNYLKVLSHF